MGIIVSCCCGKHLEAPEEAAGRRGKCSKCGRTVFVPRSTDRGLVYYTGRDLELGEAALQQAVCELPTQDRQRILDEADKWAKAWRLPPDRKPHCSGFELICDIVTSCLQRDATVGMDSLNVTRDTEQDMVSVAVSRRGRTLLHFVARCGDDEFIAWHHRDADDEAVENEKQRTDVLQALSAGVHCDLCDYNLGCVRLLSKVGLAPLVGYRCAECGKIFCSKCHGKSDRGCPACGASRSRLQYLAHKVVKN